VVKLAAARTNHELGRRDSATFAAIETACSEMIDGQLDEHVVVAALQGASGTSTNMDVNEVIAKGGPQEPEATDLAAVCDSSFPPSDVN
jgi:fumarate hydratase class II